MTAFAALEKMHQTLILWSKTTKQEKRGDFPLGYACILSDEGRARRLTELFRSRSNDRAIANPASELGLGLIDPLLRWH